MPGSRPSSPMDPDEFILIDQFEDVYGVDFIPPFDDVPSFVLYDINDKKMSDDIIIDRFYLEDGVVKKLGYAFNYQVNTAMIIETERSRCQLGRYGDEIMLQCERM